MAGREEGVLSQTGNRQRGVEYEREQGYQQYGDKTVYCVESVC